MNTLARLSVAMCATVILPIPLVAGPQHVAGHEAAVYQVGVAAVDITPGYPVRLSGFGFRREEAAGVTQPIWAKALAIDDGHGPVVLITVDNLGIPASMVHAVARRLADVGVRPDRLAITATHTHTAPMLTDVAPTLFGVPIPPAHQQHIDRYTHDLTKNLEKVARQALKARA
ncbi:MAG TPA: neutral/alkaline non-lysosomal ceramidase N-terminal domain-containing protein, partial [Gemmataceae bacterium]|nr:neutral/alkaline non-lysosomal ceramidase N-terminal domain-containing protein [Gemmataceae bacterium]